MKKPLSSLMSSFLFASFFIPLDQAKEWQVLKYSGIEANKVSFSKKGLFVEVMSSASPIIYPFHKAKQIKSIRITARTSQSNLRFPAGKIQGSKGFDDFPLRVGLVKQGKRTLSWIERQMAPNWVTTLFKLAPEGVGVKNITYLSAVNQAQLLNSQRKHPFSDLIEEQFVSMVKKDGHIEIYKEFQKSDPILALWIAVDGDDTKSDFNTLIEKIEIEEI